MMDMLASVDWFLVGEWLIRGWALVYVPFRRSPDSAKGWLLLFFVVPIAALVLYFFFGRARYPKWRRERAAMLPEVLTRASGRAEPAEGVRERLSDDLKATADLAEAIGRLPPVTARSLELVPDYDAVFVRLVDEIDAADDHVHLLFYIFAWDGAGERILSALERAAARGVTCRLLIDAFGSGTAQRRIRRRLRESAVRVELILPFRFGGRSTRADMRNHRKIAVIDGRSGWVGSQNIVDGQAQGAKPNQELMVRVTGPIVSELQAVFVGDWFLETEEELDDAGLFPTLEPGDTVAQVVASGPDYPRARIDMLFVDLLNSARERVTITTPYFVPSEPLFFALRASALQGLNVQLIVSAETDSRFVDLAQGSYFAALLDAGVEIALCETHFLHAKHMSVDDTVALIGSSNMDMRSFELNSEITLVSYGPEVVAELRHLEERYLSGSRMLTAESWADRPLPRKLAANIARLMSPLL